MATLKPYNKDARYAPTYVNARVLAAGVAESTTVPSGAKWVMIHSSTPSTTFVQFDGTTATVPTDTTDGSAATPLGAEGHVFNVENVRTISVISSGTPIVAFEYYK